MMVTPVQQPGTSPLPQVDDEADFQKWKAAHPAPPPSGDDDADFAKWKASRPSFKAEAPPVLPARIVAPSPTFHNALAPRAVDVPGDIDLSKPAPTATFQNALTPRLRAPTNPATRAPSPSTQPPSPTLPSVAPSAAALTAEQKFERTHGGAKPAQVATDETGASVITGHPKAIGVAKSDIDKIVSDPKLATRISARLALLSTPAGYTYKPPAPGLGELATDVALTDIASPFLGSVAEQEKARKMSEYAAGGGQFPAWKANLLGVLAAGGAVAGNVALSKGLGAGEKMMQTGTEAAGERIPEAARAGRQLGARLGTRDLVGMEAGAAYDAATNAPIGAASGPLMAGARKAIEDVATANELHPSAVGKILAKTAAAVRARGPQLAEAAAAGGRQAAAGAAFTAASDVAQGQHDPAQLAKDIATGAAQFGLLGAGTHALAAEGHFQLGYNITRDALEQAGLKPTLETARTESAAPAETTPALLPREATPTAQATPTPPTTPAPVEPIPATVAPSPTGPSAASEAKTPFSLGIRPDQTLPNAPAPDLSTLEVMKIIRAHELEPLVRNARTLIAAQGTGEEPHMEAERAARQVVAQYRDLVHGGADPLAAKRAIADGHVTLAEDKDVAWESGSPPGRAAVETPEQKAERIAQAAPPAPGASETTPTGPISSEQAVVESDIRKRAKFFGHDPDAAVQLYRDELAGGTARTSPPPMPPSLKEKPSPAPSPSPSVATSAAKPIRVYRGRVGMGEVKSDVPYFTPSQKHAQDYAWWQAHDRGIANTEDTSVLAADLHLQKVAGEDDIRRVAEQHSIELPDEDHPIVGLEQRPNLVAALRAEGYDGARGKDHNPATGRDDVTAYAVLDKSKIKPAAAEATPTPSAAPARATSAEPTESPEQELARLRAENERLRQGRARFQIPKADASASSAKASTGAPRGHESVAASSGEGAGRAAADVGNVGRGVVPRSAAEAPRAPGVAGEGVGSVARREAAPPPAQAQPTHADVAEVAKDLAARPHLPGPVGHDSPVHFSDGSSVKARYRVVEAADLQPSHNATSFARNPAYPEGIQGREYAGTRGTAARQHVETETGKLRAAPLLDATGGTTDGAPVITPHGLAVAGNQRAMMLQRAPSMAPEKYQAYRDELTGRAHAFGLDPEQIRGMTAPVLVREIADPSVNTNDVPTLSRLNQLSDQTPTKAKDVLSAALGRATQMQRASGALAHFTDTVGPDETVRDYLGTANGTAFVRKLFEDGVVGPQERGAFVDAHGSVTAAGKDAIEAALRVAAIGDPDIIHRAPSTILRKLDSAIPAIIQANATKDYALTHDVQSALDLLSRVDAMKADMQGRGEKVGSFGVDQYLQQQDMFGNDVPDATADFARFLERTSKPLVTATLREYAKRAVEAHDASQSEDIFGHVAESPRKLSQRLFTGNVAEPSADYGDEPSPMLSGLHNLSAENLIAADKLGGFPAPSLAVVPEGQPFNQYGTITLIGKSSTFDPRSEPVFEADAYTGRAPRPEYRPRPWKEISAFVTPLRDVFERAGDESVLPQITNDLEHGDPGEAESHMVRSPGAQLAFLESRGEHVDVPTREKRLRFPHVSTSRALRDFFAEHGVDRSARPGDAYWSALSKAVERGIDEWVDANASDDPELAEQLRTANRRRLLNGTEVPFGYGDQIMDDQEKVGQEEPDLSALQDRLDDLIKPQKAAFERWVHDRLEPFRKNPYIKVGRRKSPYTLESATEAAVRARSIAGAEKTMTFGAGNARAVASTRFKDITHARNAAHQIKTPDEVRAAVDALQERADQWRTDLLAFWPDAGGFGGTWEGLDAMHRGIATYLKRGPVPAAQVETMRGALRREGFRDLSRSIIDESIAMAKAIRDMPVDYFEAKPQRAVDFSEFAGAAIPEDASPVVREILDRRGVPYREYKPNDTTSRATVVNRFRRELHAAGQNTLMERRATYRAQLDLFNRTQSNPTSPEAQRIDHEDATRAFGSVAARDALANELAPFVAQLKAAGFPEAPARRLLVAKKLAQGPAWADLTGADVSTVPKLRAALSVMRHPLTESLSVLFKNANGEVVDHFVYSSGALATVKLDNASLVSDVAERAKALGVTTVTVAHNHPSGDPTPSSGDRLWSTGFDFLLGNHGIKVDGHMVIDHDTAVWMPREGAFGPDADQQVLMHGTDDAEWVTAIQSGAPKVTSKNIASLLRDGVSPDATTVFYRDFQGRILAAEPRSKHESGNQVLDRVDAERAKLGAYDVVLAAGPERAAELRQRAHNARLNGEPRGHYVTDVVVVAPNHRAGAASDTIATLGEFSAPTVSSSVEHGFYPPPDYAWRERDRNATAPTAERVTGPGAPVAAPAQSAGSRGRSNGLLHRPSDTAPLVADRVAEPTDLFGNEDEFGQQDARPSDQGSLLGDTAGRRQTLAETEAAARSRIARLRQELSLLDGRDRYGRRNPALEARQDARRREIAAELVPLEKLVNRGQKISPDEVQARVAAGDRLGEPPTLFGEDDADSQTNDEGAPITGIKNAVNASERERLGMDERATPEPRTQDEMYEAGKAVADADPTAIPRLLAELRANPEKIVGTKTEAGLLLKHRVDLDNKLKALLAAKDEATASGDAGAEQLARVQLQAHREAIKEFVQLAERTGTATGRALAARRMMSTLDYSLSNMEAMAEAAKGAPLTEQELAKIRALHEELQTKLAAAEQDLVDARERAANAEADLHHALLKLEVAGPLLDRITKRLDTAADAAMARIRARGLRAMAGMDPEDLADHAIIGAAELAKGLRHFAQWSDAMVQKLGASIRPHLEEIFDAAGKRLDEELSKEGTLVGTPARATREKTPKPPTDVREKLTRRLEQGVDNLSEIRPYLRQLALEHIRSGITSRESVLTALHTDLTSLGIDVTRAEVRDALSGYGEFRPLDKAADKARLREIQAESQKLAQLEALERGKAPLASGFERQPPSDETRRLTKAVNEAKKRAGVGQIDQAGRLKSALASAKTRTANAIKDIQTEIDTGQRLVRGKATLISDPELDALRTQLKELRKVEAEMFMLGKPGLTEAQRLALATKAAERNATAWQTRLDQARGGTFSTKAQRPTLTTPELDALRAKAKAARQEYEELKRLDPAQQQAKNDAANQAYRTRLAQREADLLDRLAREDYSPKPLRPGTTLDRESIRRKAEVEAVKQRYQEGLHRFEQAHRSPVEKARDLGLAWVRFGALSWPTVIGKLSSVALSRVVTTPLTDVAALGVSNALPRLAQGAPRYGTRSPRVALAAEAKAWAAMWVDGVRNSGQMLMNKRSRLELLHGKQKLPPALRDYMGRLHGALKEPIKEAEYARYVYRATVEAAERGENVTDPIVQLRISNEGYLYAERAVSMNANIVTDWWNAGLRRLEQKDKATGKANPLGLFLSTALQTDMPIVKAPTNVILEASEYIAGLPIGGFRAAWAYAHGIEDLKPVERDSIIRMIAKGAVGAALMALYLYKAMDPKAHKGIEFGGFYHPGEKRKPTDVPVEGLRVGSGPGHLISSKLLHNPLFAAGNFAASIARLAPTKARIHDADPQGYGSALWAASVGLLDETPIIRSVVGDTRTLSDPQQASKFFAQKIASLAVPGVIQWAAKATDPAPTRKPVGLLQNVKADIPHLREEVPTWRPKHGGGDGINAFPNR